MVKFDLSNGDYHADSAIGKSDLVLAARSVLHYQSAKAAPRRETPAMRIGSATHAAILEPEEYAARYAAMPPCDRRTKEGKALAAEFEAANAGKTVISQDEAETIDRMRLSILAHPIARQLVSGGRAEASVFWTDPATCLRCKCRPDYLLLDQHTVVDLKTTEDASTWPFARSCATYKYNAQQAWYMDGLQAEGLDVDSFLFVAVEKEPPHAVAVYTIEPAAVEAGRAWCRAALENLAVYYDRVANGEEPYAGYPPVVAEISLPVWATRKEEVYYE